MAKFIEVANVVSGRRTLIAVDEIITVNDQGKETFIELYITKNGKGSLGITTKESYAEVVAKLSEADK